MSLGLWLVVAGLLALTTGVAFLTAGHSRLRERVQELEDRADGYVTNLRRKGHP